MIRRLFSTSKKTFKADKLQINKAAYLTPNFPKENLPFGAISTPHMLRINWNEKDGWEAPVISPLANLSLHPFNSTLHYAISCFEGLKVFKDEKGQIRLFRIDRHARRFNESCHRLSLPTFDENEFIKLIKIYANLERDWVPPHEGSSLYVRPLGMSNTNVLGVHPAIKSSILVMACPVSAYFPKKDEGTKKKSGLFLGVNETYWRGTPHSASQYKIASNYAPTISILQDDEKHGFSQTVWTYDENLLESGATNLFFVLKTPKGEELVTHPLDGSVLPGITRDSIIALAEKIQPGIKVCQRAFKIPEFIEKHKKKEIKEVFVSGTGAVTGAVECLKIRGHHYKMEIDEEHNKFSTNAKKLLFAIQYGKIEHEYSVLVDKETKS